MAELKTKPTDNSVTNFLNAVEDERQRKDSFVILEMMKEATKAEPKMWGASIIGFGSYHYKYDSGHEGDSCLTGFSPRKQSISLYIMAGLEQNKSLLQKLGKHKVGKGCLYINKLEDIDTEILKELIKSGIDFLKKKYKISSIAGQAI